MRSSTLRVAWKDTAAHGVFIAHPDRVALVKDHPELFPSSGTADMVVCHTHLIADPLPLLAAPIVEHAFLTPKDGVSLEDLKNTLLRAQARLLEHKDICYGAVMGTIEERPDQLLILAGWKSLEVRACSSNKSGLT